MSMDAAVDTAPVMVLRAHGRRSLVSRLRGSDDRDLLLTCPACGWVCSGAQGSALTLTELGAHVCGSPAPRRRRTGRTLPALAAVTALVAAGAVLALGGPGAVRPAPAGPTQALVLSGSSLPYTDAQAVADQLRWQAQVYALPGGGISRSTLDAAASVTGTARRLLPAPGGAPDVVVIQGGEADHAAPPQSLQTATQHLVDYVQAYTGPETRLVLVGPIPGARVPNSLRTVNDVLAGVAAERGVPYVDAIALGWRAGDPAVRSALADELRALLG